jgi:L-ribulose-5-phosphate 3-epimerase
MRLAGHTLGTPEQTVPEALALFAAAGLDAAEVIYQDGYRSGLPLRDRRSAEEARRASEDVGVPIVGMTPYTTGINALDEGEWRTAVDEFRGAIEIAQIVGADRLRVYAGSWHLGDQDHGAHRNRLVTALRTLAPEASDAGVRLCVENHFGTMTQSAAETARLVREVGHDAVRVLYDQANLTFTHDEPYQEALRIQGDVVGHVHVKDLVFTDPDAPFQASETARVAASERTVRSRVVGDGVVPWAAILSSLSALGYDDVLSLEYEYRWHPEDLPEPAVGFARSAAVLRSLLAQAAVAESAR